MTGYPQMFLYVDDTNIILDMWHSTSSLSCPSFLHTGARILQQTGALESRRFILYVTVAESRFNASLWPQMCQEAFHSWRLEFDVD